MTRDPETRTPMLCDSNIYMDLSKWLTCDELPAWQLTKCNDTLRSEYVDFS
ncbi:hypothetical protein AMATHDRAFT_172491, partial [Amanita thiersii Skay4041]